MRQVSKIACLIMFVVFTSISTFAYDFTVDGIFYNYNLEEGTAIVTSEYEGGSTTRSYSGNVIIPNVVNFNGRTLKVTAIWHHAFWDCNELISVQLPETIKSIGYNAFTDCDELASVNIPNNTISIGEKAFSGCKKLVINNIPSSLEIIGDGAFSGCSGFTSLSLPNNISIGNNAFSGCNDLEQVTISKGEIGQWAFAYCPNLKQFNILGEVSSIGLYVLENCPVEISVFVEESSNPLEITTYPSNYTARYGDIGNLYMGRTPRFWGYDKLKTIAIGANITDIQLKYATNIQIVYSRLTSPELCNANFSNNTFVNAKLYVPIGTKGKYLAADGWKNFFMIEEMDIDKMWNGQGEPNVESQDKEKCEKPTIRYSNGKLLFESATEGAVCQSTITDSDITSYSGNEVLLGVTYNISVYATASGYEDSDVATATLCWIDVDPKTEGVENSVSQVRSQAVLIQTNNGILSISGVENGTDIAVYSSSGMMVGSAKSIGESSSIATNLRNGEIAIVKIGDKAVKVVIK